MSEVLTPRSIEQKSGTNAKGRPWTLYRVEFTEGTRASTFDSKTATFLQANFGKPVNVEITQGEKGKDLAGAWPIDGEAPAMKARISVEKKSGDDFLRERNPRESRTIARQACLKAAVQLIVAEGVSGDIRADGTLSVVLDIADRFVEWVFREETGVRHIKAEFTSADVEAERKAISEDKPADQLTKDAVVAAIPQATADARAVLHNYGIQTVKDIQARLTDRVARLFMEANGDTETERIPL